MTAAKSEIRDGMRIEWDMPIRMDDSLVLRADVFRPVPEGRYPVILSYDPYGKGLAFQDGYKTAWEIMARDNPDSIAGSSNKYQSWEVVDPEKWVPDVSEKLVAAGLIIVTESPDFFGGMIRSYYAKYGKLARDIGFKPQWASVGRFRTEANLARCRRAEYHDCRNGEEGVWT